MLEQLMLLENRRYGYKRRVMKIQILCHECQECQECILLEKNVVTAAKGIGLEIELERIDRHDRIALTPVKGRPGLLINDEMRSIGRVLSPQELIKMFTFILRAG